MCGIAGWCSEVGSVKYRCLEVMGSALHHRGPDGAGIFVSEQCNVGFGHRRLSIVDLDQKAGQPMKSSWGTVLIFNGEIYNHAELRKELVGEGVRFETDHSDSEVLLHGYDRWGLEKLLRRINGMFAFAIYDPRAEVVFLARDRLGIKPLYYSHFGGDFLFASEIKAILASGLVKAELNTSSLSRYFGFRFVPPPETLFRGVQKLRAGTYLKYGVRDQSLQEKKYWTPLCANTGNSKGRDKAVSELREIVESATEYRVGADVPVGIFLSGGVDSGYLAHAAGKRVSGDFNAFTIGYSGHPEYDESNMAARFANRCGAKLHSVDMEVGELRELMATIAFYQDEPIAAPVCLSIFRLAEAARSEGVPVILAGEGGDELFVGYQNWLRLRSLQHLDSSVPDFPGRLMRKAALGIASIVLPQHARSYDLVMRSAFGYPLFWGGAMDFGIREREGLLEGSGLKSSVKSDYEEVIEPLWDEYRSVRGSGDITGWMSFLDMSLRLPELMLPRLDKMGMAHSIEGRVPLLDHRLAEFAMSLPPELHEGTGRVGKGLLKEAATEYLEREEVYGTKKGFQVPVSEWRHSKEGEFLRNALFRFASVTGLLNSDFLERLYRRKHDRLYFSLLNFMFWYLIYIDECIPDVLPASGPWRGVKGALSD